jgi:hypothetical protein
MHHSRLAGLIIDCCTGDLGPATAFWSAALGMADLGADGPSYRRLDAAARDLAVEVQAVDHPSRVHLDIETDDVEAEVARLERLGARRVAQVRTFWVLEAPAGQRFCVVPAEGDLSRAAGATAWP